MMLSPCTHCQQPAIPPVNITLPRPVRVLATATIGGGQQWSPPLTQLTLCPWCARECRPDNGLPAWIRETEEQPQ